MSDESPEWYDESKLRKVYYADGYMGWVVDLGDGTCRFANEPLLGCDDDSNPEKDAINAARPRWGDRVPLVEDEDGMLRVDASKIIERYVGG